VKRFGTAVNSQSNVIIFTCSWYPAIAADNAGVTREEYPADTRIVTLACAGRLTPALILDAFGSGACGVLVAACKPELCHYVNGSSTCEQVVTETKELAELLGIGARRIHLETFDTEDGKRFADCVKQFCGRMAEMGAVITELQ
jgi:coenzyme F420-reducing hydrogenase delta subunit